MFCTDQTVTGFALAAEAGRKLIALSKAFACLLELALLWSRLSTSSGFPVPPNVLLAWKHSVKLTASDACLPPSWQVYIRKRSNLGTTAQAVILHPSKDSQPDVSSAPPVYLWLHQTVCLLQVLESYYGQDLDSGHHGSGFPLPPFRQRLLDLHLQKQAADKSSSRSNKGDSDTGDDSKQRTYTQEETVYSEHAWNINNLPRCKVRLACAHMLIPSFKLVVCDPVPPRQHTARTMSYVLCLVGESHGQLPLLLTLKLCAVSWQTISMQELLPFWISMTCWHGPTDSPTSSHAPCFMHRA